MRRFQWFAAGFSGLLATTLLVLASTAGAGQPVLTAPTFTGSAGNSADSAGSSQPRRVQQAAASASPSWHTPGYRQVRQGAASGELPAPHESAVPAPPRSAATSVAPPAAAGPVSRNVRSAPLVGDGDEAPWITVPPAPGSVQPNYEEIPGGEYAGPGPGYGPEDYGNGCCDGCGCGCGNGCGDACCGGCGGCGCGCYGHHGPIKSLLACAVNTVHCTGLWPQSASLNLGVHGFKGPVDLGVNGNFGFQEGFNLGGAIGPYGWLSYQFGMQFVQSNYSGNNVVNAVDEQRDQTFLTAGVFHRACGYGWQGGVVFDYLNDEYYAEGELTQIRAEISFLTGGGHEFGSWIAAGGDDANVLVNVGNNFVFLDVWEATEQYVFFYRHTFCGASQLRVWGGFTGEADGLFGADMYLPLACSWAVQGGFNYLIPEDDPNNDQEAWNVGLNLVWYPGQNVRCPNPHRPLLPVADNGSFFVDRQ